MRVGIDVLLLFVALTFSCPSFRAFSKASEFCSAMEIEEDAFWALCFFLRAQEDVYRARFANSAVRQRVLRCHVFHVVPRPLMLLQRVS